MAADGMIHLQVRAPPKWVLLLVGLLILARVPWLPGAILDATIRVSESPARG